MQQVTGAQVRGVQAGTERHQGIKGNREAGSGGSSPWLDAFRLLEGDCHPRRWSEFGGETRLTLT